MHQFRKGSKELIKDMNRYIVLDHIRRHGPSSRSDIAKKTKIGMSTLTNITEEFLQANLLIEAGTVHSTGGRKPVLLQLNSEYGYTFGIKIEEENIRIALTNLHVKIVHQHEAAFPKGSDPEFVINMIVMEVHRILKRYELSLQHCLGIGLAVSGLINRETGVIVRSTLLGWKNVSICEYISGQLDRIPVFIDKNINAYTLAECWFGIGKKFSDFVCVSVGAGVGLSLVLQGDLYYGNFGGAGEFGHTIVQMNGYPCHCGQNGCLEMYASEHYFTNEGPLLKDQYESTLITEYTFDGVWQAFAQKDRLAQHLLQKLGVHLGYGIVNIINSLNPKKIVLIGEGMKYQSAFLPYAMETAENNFFAAANLNTEIAVSELGDDSWLQGAALLAMEQLFHVPIYEKQKDRRGSVWDKHS
ncbi:ROK family transcriptional regulator [Bacillus sp. 165]|uniref:ROK family transcriptional regulator n=1 Tax=Bacillus sp. 165 TaxID=1529117 RepID=UPI001ADB38E0|nr:ROK family transcriptional regulator [Bacillus sp. 165]MBO9129119.1 ROK family transcriptional regulator [Bacillus sp. 165]